MRCVWTKKAIKEISVGMGVLVCLSFIGCKDKSAATDHYERGEAHYLAGEYDQAFSELTKARMRLTIIGNASGVGCSESIIRILAEANFLNAADRR